MEQQPAQAALHVQLHPLGALAAARANVPQAPPESRAHVRVARQTPSKILRATRLAPPAPLIRRAKRAAQSVSVTPATRLIAAHAVPASKANTRRILATPGAHPARTIHRPLRVLRAPRNKTAPVALASQGQVGGPVCQPPPPLLHLPHLQGRARRAPSQSPRPTTHLLHLRAPLWQHTS